MQKEMEMEREDYRGDERVQIFRLRDAEETEDRRRR